MTFSDACPVGRGTSISDQIEQPNDKRPTITFSLAQRLLALAPAFGAGGDGWARPILARAAYRLSTCARGEQRQDGTRCGAAYCPRCARQRGAAYRRRLDERMHDRVAMGFALHGFALLTLTIAANCPAAGRAALGRAFSRFLRRRGVRRIVGGGEAHVHVEPARGTEGDRWNVHLHAVVELRGPLDRRSPKTRGRIGAPPSNRWTCVDRQIFDKEQTWKPGRLGLGAATWVVTLWPPTSHDGTWPNGAMRTLECSHVELRSWRRPRGCYSRGGPGEGRGAAVRASSSLLAMQPIRARRDAIR
jgi:hypothetical protein